ncbi:50S ribosomal protein L10 [Ichthyobacterium seriolicida]|uniref:Large ribosomal subunit protein uL10 n=1 Tax=Ichthyobacterium seriolicida TaxID=242600 RepID=A0A1J1E867_9FLAO|nr:50S ribosomal protein L10 [Ichthyobacterium seriolicida]BAV94123.1 50S ribosomal protein L10 [Ichthyobacterium seriolicida]
MRREKKEELVNDLIDKIDSANNIYLADISGLNAKSNSSLRRDCFKENVKLLMVKNTLIKKAMDASTKDLEGVYISLKGSTSVMLSEVGNTPAKLIKKNRAKGSKLPLLKAAYIEGDTYIGDDKLESLISIKSREEIISGIVGLLQSPAKNVISSLQSGGQKLSGVIKSLSDR